MSTAITGVIERVVFDEMKQPDQWGKTHRAKIVVAGTYYSCGGIKPSPRGDLQLRVQNGKDWETLEAGDAVQFFAKSRDVNGKTYWDKDGQIKLTAKGSGSPPQMAPAPAPRPAAAPAPAAGGAAVPPAAAPRSATGFDARSIEIKAGRAVNNAVLLHTAGKADTLQDALKLAIKLERYADTNYSAIYASLGAPVEATPTPAVAAPAPAVPAPTPPPVQPAPKPAQPAPQPVAAPVETKVEFDEQDIPF